jgi:hypothetical protein
MRVLRPALKVIASIIVLGMLAYLGACVYGNWIAKPKGTVTLPSVDKAPYILTVKNTGTILLSSKVEQVGPDIQGQRMYRLPDGYWEMAKGGKFRYVKLKDFPMDETIWGPITVTRRSD